jgi:hypothetical protein
MLFLIFQYNLGIINRVSREYKKEEKELASLTDFTIREKKGLGTTKD